MTDVLVPAAIGVALTALLQFGFGINGDGSFVLGVLIVLGLILAWNVGTGQT